jgi:hypothetical protein
MVSPFARVKQFPAVANSTTPTFRSEIPLENGVFMACAPFSFAFSRSIRHAAVAPTPAS